MKSKYVFSPPGFSLPFLFLVVLAFHARFVNAAWRFPDSSLYKIHPKEAEDFQPEPTTTAAPPDDPDDAKYGSGKNRNFDPHCCKQRIRTSYVTSDICGKAALCYWEIWNYRTQKSIALKDESYKDECDQYMVQKYICLIGYPKPFKPNAACEPALLECDRILSKMLYEDCEPLRQKRGLLRPQDVHHHIRTKDMNFDLSDNPDKHFQPLPNSDAPTHNNFYAISCPIIYRYPYFTINLLLKDLDPSIDYDETHALEGVGAMIPLYARVGMEKEREVNFKALSLKDDMINWCGVPRNYICIKADEEDRDKKGEVCKWDKLDESRQKCEPDVPMPMEKPKTKQVFDVKKDSPTGKDTKKKS